MELYNDRTWKIQFLKFLNLDEIDSKVGKRKGEKSCLEWNEKHVDKTENWKLPNKNQKFFFSKIFEKYVDKTEN